MRKIASVTFIKRCPKGYKIYKNLDSELKDVIKKWDTDSNRKYCIYRVLGPDGTLFYIGQGVMTRPASHSGDDVGNNIGPGWTIEIVAIGLTKLEARFWESYLIRDALRSGRTLTKPGTKWNGVSLMNRNKGMCDEDYKDYKLMFYGNNPGIAA